MELLPIRSPEYAVVDLFAFDKEQTCCRAESGETRTKLDGFCIQ